MDIASDIQYTDRGDSYYKNEKFDAKEDEGIFVGYAVGKAYRVYNLRTNIVMESVHVVFDDKKIEGLQDEDFHESLKFDNVEMICDDSDDEITHQDNYEASSSRANLPQQRKWTRDHPFKLIIDDASSRVQTWKVTQEKFLYNSFLSQEEPKKVEEALLHPDWVLAMQEELNQFERNKVWKLVPKPKGKNHIDTKWADPKESHLVAIKRFFRHLKGTPKLGIWYPRDSGFDLTGYSDTDYACYKIDRKCTTGTCQFIGNKIVSWFCKMQNLVSTSTVEAKYIAAGSCCAHILWMKNQLLDYGLQVNKILIFRDNTSAIAITENPVQHSRTKHIDIKYHFIREHVMNGTVELHFVPSEKQLADIFTKPLDESTFTRLVSELGMLNYT
ncbi:hypothetical protein AgCh_000465 [Apium graveolens]